MVVVGRMGLRSKVVRLLGWALGVFGKEIPGFNCASVLLIPTIFLFHKIA